MKFDITSNNTILSLDLLEDETINKVNGVSFPMAFIIHNHVQSLITIAVNFAVIW